MKLLHGRPAAERILAEVASYAERHTLRLGIIRVGEHEPSRIYVGRKLEAAKRAGIEAHEIHLPATAKTEEVVSVVKAVGEDPSYTALIVQLPLPAGIDEAAVLDAIPPQKDADGLHPYNLGLLAQGRAEWVAATPWGIVELLRYYGLSVAGKHVVVLGRGRLVGTPLSILLSRHAPYGQATVTLCHSQTPNLYHFTRQADIVVSAVGKPHWLPAEAVSEGVILIDVGIHRVGGRIVGDIHPDALAKASAATPVPGGVGPLTVAALLWNVMVIHRHRLRTGSD
jgi:methylenetetrahydrofolate dehydrogenase (NADP+)/methenyltetrahydrofolate cyclohydrolase